MGAVVSRSDVRRNRERIVAAARELYATRGLDVPMAAIARRAGVGMATLYRHFGSKDTLVSTVFAEQFAQCVSVVDDVLLDPDPWRGFRVFVERVCAMQVEDRGFSRAFLTTYPEAARSAVAESGGAKSRVAEPGVAGSGAGGSRVAESGAGVDRARALRGFVTLIERAKTAGRLRPDFSPADLLIIVAAVGGVVAVAPEAADVLTHRLVGYFLAAFDADHVGPALPENPLDLAGLLEYARVPMDASPTIASTIVETP